MSIAISFPRILYIISFTFEVLFFIASGISNIILIKELNGLG